VVDNIFKNSVFVDKISNKRDLKKMKKVVDKVRQFWYYKRAVADDNKNKKVVDNDLKV